jgi:hypothetical protein
VHRPDRARLDQLNRHARCLVGLSLVAQLRGHFGLPRRLGHPPGFVQRPASGFSQ